MFAKPSTVAVKMLYKSALLLLAFQRLVYWSAVEGANKFL